MTRWFNVAGPCFADEHYMIPPERRGGEVFARVEQGRWFCLVSGRQTGKTTVLRWVWRELWQRAEALPLLVDLQTARDLPEVRPAMQEVFAAIDSAWRGLPAPVGDLPDDDARERWLAAPQSALKEFLSEVCRRAGRPVVLLFDEADCLVGPAMVSFLTQLRALYLARKEHPAPRAVALIGTRAVRDYALAAEDRRTLAWLGTASPFNVTVETVGLRAFTADEVAELLAQHTAETGQAFTPEAVAAVVSLSQGHPWLVNALADQSTRLDVTDHAVAVTTGHIERAKETLILERRTHVDSLIARLHEARVRRVLAPMLAGEVIEGSTVDDDLAYVAGLGLIRLEGGSWQAANPIYREVIPRALTHARQTQIDQQTAWYLRADGGLDMGRLMAGWQSFWREDGHLAAEGFDYKEAGPHLMLMAFLQRVVNGGGRIDREYVLGKGALDLLVTWKGERFAIELKQRRDARTLARGVAQVAGYAKSLGLKEAWLVMFDRRKSVPWSKRLTQSSRKRDGVTVRVLGC